MSAIDAIFTIGHSTHSIEAFLELLCGERIGAIADVRRYPGSRRMPWFNQGALAPALAEADLDYVHLEELGGRRNPVPGSPNGGWRVGQFQGYADHMASEGFAGGLGQLLELAAARRTAVMCAEALWTSCHRRLLSDVLVARGHEVLHVGGRGGVERHELTDFAVVDGERVTYPRTQAALDV